MSARELARVEVLGRVKAGTLPLVQAGPLLGVGYRQAKRLWRRFKRGGAKALRHRHAGVASNRGMSTKTRQRVLALIRQKYGGDLATRFGPTLVAEHLASEDGVDRRPRNAASLDAGGGAVEPPTEADAVSATASAQGALRRVSAARWQFPRLV